MSLLMDYWFWSNATSKADNAQVQANASAALAQSLKHENAELRQSVARLSLLSQAMWTLMTEKLGVTDAELVARIEQLQAQQPVVGDSCQSCGRPMMRHHTTCIYCGQDQGTSRI